MNFNCIVVLGPTASGKTKLACRIAHEIDGEIISADSRQVYRHLNIGTGKDLEEYFREGKRISYHLIDIADASEQFYIHQYIAEQKKAFDVIQRKCKIPVICGGTGLYLDTLHKDFSFTQIKENDVLRASLSELSKEQLVLKLKTYPEDHIRHVDVNSAKRLVRGIEIADHLTKQQINTAPYKSFYKPFYVGIKAGREEIKKRIASRLSYRLNNGMVEEAEALLSAGLTHERMQQLGLEYKFISMYLQGRLSFKELMDQLQTAIFQFSKRQMTWFRKMEKEGVKINWITSGSEQETVITELKKLFSAQSI